MIKDTPILPLSDYLSAIKLAIDELFGTHSVWIRCELRAVSTKGGHTYFELAQKDDDGKIIASCRANLWRSKAGVIKKFEQITGRRLEAGLSVLLKGSATFHPQYGFSFNVMDINPEFTLGELALQYQAMLKNLTDNGLIDQNKSHPTPFDVQNVLVIAPQNAAGLGDFRAEADKLQRANVCHFHYKTATFQGNHAPQEIREALTYALAELAQLPDLVVIIRGGGAVGDLAYLNDYELACVIAELPCPVWVGIGHERDRVILDEVAHTSFDTPSKVITGIVNLLSNRWLSANQYFLDIKQSAKTKILFAKTQAKTALSTIHRASSYRCHSQKQACDNLLKATKYQSLQTLKTAKTDIENLQKFILIGHPAHTLAKGYAIVRKNGQVICAKSASRNIEIEFYDGKITAQVLENQILTSKAKS